MKKLILLAFMALVSFTTLAQDKGMKFSSGTFNEICAEAAKSKKLVFVDVYTSWCAPCKLMAKDIFPDEAVGRFMNANFVNAKFDAENGEGKDVAKKYGVKSYPTMLILDSEGKELARMIGGGGTPEGFIKRVGAELDKIKK